MPTSASQLELVFAQHFLPALLQKLIGDLFVLGEGNLAGILRDLFGPTKYRVKKFGGDYVRKLVPQKKLLRANFVNNGLRNAQRKIHEWKTDPKVLGERPKMEGCPKSSEERVQAQNASYECRRGNDYWETFAPWIQSTFCTLSQPIFRNFPFWILSHNLWVAGVSRKQAEYCFESTGV